MRAEKEFGRRMMARMKGSKGPQQRGKKMENVLLDRHDLEFNWDYALCIRCTGLFFAFLQYKDNVS